MVKKNNYNRKGDIMEETIIALEKLITTIETSTLKKELKNTLFSIEQKQTLLANIEHYHQAPTESLRLEIFKDPDYRRYKQLENEVNQLIMAMNQILKQLQVEVKSCGL